MKFTPEKVISCEQGWINKLNPEYNVLKIAGSNRGYRYSPETKEIIRQKGLARKFTPAGKARIKLLLKVRKETQAALAKLKFNSRH